jgi:serine/threonine protein kinase/peptidoglycan hydrolase-like protein with peptidoglycan-binding domain
MPPGAGEAELVALRSGQTVGRYRIEAVLGQGGFGFTYLARDSRLGRETAIKEFAPSALTMRQGDNATVPRSNKAADEFARGRRHFLNEGRILAGLRRAPGIVRVLDCFEANGTAYTVMELAVGTTLEERLKGGGSLSAASLDRIRWPLLEGLELVHSHGFFHGDLRPANIVLDTNGKPTLVDFGTSRTGATVAWTPNYAAPEQFTSAKQGPWTDIYGLAATLYRALTGHPPPAARERMPEDTCQPLTALRPPGIPAGMLAGIDKGLSLRAADRPQTIAEWRSILWQTGKFGGAATAAAEGLPANDDRVEPPRFTRERVAPLRRPGPAPAQRTPPVDIPHLSRPSPDVPRRAAPPPEAPAEDPSPPADTVAALDEPAIDILPPRRGRALWVGLAVASALLLGGATYFLFAIPSSEPTQATAPAVDPRAEALARQHAQMAEVVARAQAEAAKQQQAEMAQQQAEAAKEAARKAEEDARRKAEAEAEAKRKAEAADPRRAQAGENALNLSHRDRLHVQVALAALGFDPKGTDGVFGPRSRKAIAAWQQSRNDPPTTFLTAAQEQALMKGGAAAISKFEAPRKSGDVANKSADGSDGKTDARAFDGEYVGMANVSTGDQPVSTYVSNGKGSGGWKVEGCGRATYALSIAPDGAAALDLRSYTLQCEPVTRRYESQMESNSLLFTFNSEGDPSGGVTLTRQQP